MTKQQHIKYGLIAAFIIGVVILLIVLFKGKSGSSQDLVDYKIAEKDSVIKKEVEKSARLESEISELKQENESLKNRDSTLVSHYNQIEQLYKNINAKINDIPGRINRVATNNDSLRILLAN